MAHRIKKEQNYRGEERLYDTAEQQLLDEATAPDISTATIQLMDPRDNKPEGEHKKLHTGRAMVAHAFNPSTLEAETGESL